MSNRPRLTTLQKALSMAQYETYLEYTQSKQPKKLERWRLDGHRDRVSAHDNPIERMGMHAIILLAQKANGPLYEWFFGPYEKRGYTVLSSGANATVLEKNGQIVKLMRYSYDEDPEAYQELIDANIQTHPDETVPTKARKDFPVHPFRRLCVALYQPKLQETARPLESLPGPLGGAFSRKVAAFATRSLDVMVPNGLAPDITGSGNLFGTQATGDLSLVDTVALNRISNPEVFEKNTQRLRRLAKARPTDYIQELYRIGAQRQNR